MPEPLKHRHFIKKKAFFRLFDIHQKACAGKIIIL